MHRFVHSIVYTTPGHPAAQAHDDDGDVGVVRPGGGNRHANRNRRQSLAAAVDCDGLDCVRTNSIEGSMIDEGSHIIEVVRVRLDEKVTKHSTGRTRGGLMIANRQPLKMKTRNVRVISRYT